MAFLKSKKALLLIPVLLIAIIGGVMLSPFSPMKQAEASQETSHSKSSSSSGAKKASTAKEPTAPGPMYTLKERVVNITDPTGRRYLKIAANIELTRNADLFEKAEAKERAKLQAEFDKEMAPWAPMIDDAVISIVSSHATTDFVNAEGKNKLKTEIKEALNKLLGEDEVSNVYFTQFVTQ